MKNISFPKSGSSSIEKRELILNFIMLLTCFSISIITAFNISPVFAAMPELPVFKIRIETIAYPSGSPEAKMVDAQVIQSVNQMRNAGFSDPVDKLFLAYKNKDIAWEVAQTILKKIQNNQINSANIVEYVSPDIKQSFNSKKRIELIIKKIRSYGDLANLSIKQYKGVFPDRMFIKKEFNQDRVFIRVIDFVYHDFNYQKKGEHPLSYITLVLSAEPPYKNWFLSEIYIKSFSYTN